MSKKYFVVADVHSYYTILRETIEDKGFELDNPNHYLICCGDLFDRGPGAKDLLEFVQSLGDRFIYIRGNHEDLLNDCVTSLRQGFALPYYDFTNGTVSTISQLTGIVDEDDFKCDMVDDSTLSEIYAKMRVILDWIYSKSVNYFELKDYVFVHGWLPIIYEGHKDQINKNWRDLSDFQWKEARWINGMNSWFHNIKLEGKTIVCGHYHCSWGWSHLDQDRKEFPPKNRPGWQKSFEPYIKEGIIALDACTSYSGLMNCLVIEDE